MLLALHRVFCLFLFLFLLLFLVLCPLRHLLLYLLPVLVNVSYDAFSLTLDLSVAKTNEPLSRCRSRLCLRAFA
jgi:hypothetical protein